MANDLWAQRRMLLPEQSFQMQTPAGLFVAQVTTAALSVCTPTPDGLHEYYVIEQEFQFNPSQMYAFDDDGCSGFFGVDYSVETVPVDYAGSKKMALISISPDTTIGAASYTASLSETFSGNIGVMGDQLTANVGESVTVSHAKTVQIADVSVLNNSLVKVNDANFTFRFENNNIDVNEGMATAVSRSLFQPTIATVWRLGTHDTGQPPMKFNTTIHANFARTETRAHAMRRVLGLKPQTETCWVANAFDFGVTRPETPEPSPK
jgi:hypothetical protein